MSVSFKIEGLQDLDAQLEKLSKSAGKGVLRRTLRDAAEPLAEKARAIVRKKKRALEKSITISTKLDERQSRMHRRMFRDDKASVEMFVGPSYELGDGGRHGHLVEFGTAPHIVGGVFKGARHPGTAPQPFMRPAWDADQQQMLERLKAKLWAEIQKSIARAERKAARQAAKG